MKKNNKLRLLFLVLSIVGSCLLLLGSQIGCGKAITSATTSTTTTSTTTTSTTTTTLDTVPPYIITAEVIPASNSTVNSTSEIRVRFSEMMNASSITGIGSFTVSSTTEAVAGTVAYDATTNLATFSVTSDHLAYATTFIATVSGFVSDANGNQMGQGYSWSFNTRSIPGLVWTKSIATFPGRHSPLVENFNGALWVLGGNTLALNLNAYPVITIIETPETDAYSSTDGETWRTEMASGFPAKIGQNIFQINNKLYVVGGTNTYNATYNYQSPPETLLLGDVTNEVWSSTNGASWFFEGLANLPSRAYCGAIVYNSKAWLIGGMVNRTGTSETIVTNEVWSSPDLVNWTKETNGSFPARMQPTVWRNNGVIYLAGGALNIFGNTLTNDAWSYDGSTWTQITPSAQFVPRNSAVPYVFDGYLFLAGGQLANGSGTSEVWRSSDGSTWALQATPGTLPLAGGTIFNNKFWYIGGGAGQGASISTNEVWSSP